MRPTYASQPRVPHFNSDASPNPAEAATAVTRQLLLLESRQREEASQKENRITERLGLLLQVCGNYLADTFSRSTALLGPTPISTSTGLVARDKIYKYPPIHRVSLSAGVSPARVGGGVVHGRGGNRKTT